MFVKFILYRYTLEKSTTLEFVFIKQMKSWEADGENVLQYMK